MTGAYVMQNATSGHVELYIDGAFVAGWDRTQFPQEAIDQYGEILSRFLSKAVREGARLQLERSNKIHV